MKPRMDAELPRLVKPRTTKNLEKGMALFAPEPMMTISANYLEMQKELHNDPHYGAAGRVFSPVVMDLGKYVNGQSISDYGDGKCRLQVGLNDLV